MAEEQEPAAEEEEEEAEPGPAWQASSASAEVEVAEVAEEEVSVQGSAWEPARGVSHHQTCRRNCDTSDRDVSECRISWSLYDLLESLDRKKQHAVMLAPFPCSER